MPRWLLTVLLAGLGAIVGVVVTFFAASRGCFDMVTDSFCGISFLVWNLSIGGAFAAAALLGAVVGTLIGALVALGLARRRPGR
jgi:hypothetical protein